MLFIASGVAGPSLAQDDVRKWGAFLDLEGKAGTKRSLGEADLFVPLLQNESTLLFGSARFKADDQNSREGNFGLGARRMLAGGWNIGGYGFFDHRRSPNANFFNQLTFGAELLGTNFDLRVNSYWPVGNGKQQVGSAAATSPSVATVSGTSVVVTTPGAPAQSFEYAMRGFDAEVGVRIPITPAESQYSMRFYAGGFRFDQADGAVQVVAGPRLRLEFTDYAVPGLWNGTRFTVGAEWQADEVRGSQFFGGFRLRVPLQAEPRRASFTLQERRMTDPIVRDVDIVTNVQTIPAESSIVEVATLTTGGQAVTVINSASTTGANLPTAIASAGSNSTVVLVGTFNTTSSITVQSGQALLGRTSLNVRTATGRAATVSLPGGTISQTNMGINTVSMSMSTNSTLSGITLNASGSNLGTLSGVTTNGASGATVSNNTITVQNSGTGSAIGLTAGAAGNTISDNSITSIAAAGGTATALSVSSATARFSGNTLSATGGGTNQHTNISNTSVLTGSTGNVISAGVCASSGGAITGSLSYTNGTTCP